MTWRIDGSGTTSAFQSTTTPGSTTKRRRQDNQARLRTKYKGRGPLYPLTSYRLPILPSKLVVALSTLYAASRRPSPSIIACPKLLPLLRPLTCLTKSQESVLILTPLSLAWTPLPQSHSEIAQINSRISRRTTTRK
jgi:hypothetical protein